MKRNDKVDWMRFLGLILIILAHINCPEVLKQIRSFDVPLMVFVSGLCYKPSKDSYFNYVKKRFKRLYYPTFIFLIIYFSLIFLIHWIGVKIPYTKSQVIGTFFLLETPSIGYVWIVRVFIIIAFLSPLLYLINNKLNSASLIILATLIYIIDFLLVKYSYSIENPYLKFIFIEFILYGIGYGIILGLSFWFKTLNNKTKLIVFITSLTVLPLLVYLVINEINLNIDYYKYPPHSYFIIYGVLCCFIIATLPLPFKDSRNLKIFVSYVSTHSLWIYFWHIPFVVFLNYINYLDDFWYIKWLLSFFGALMITFIQINIVDIFSRKNNFLIFKYLK